jgi:RNA polymerase sigma factor (sigma-70 family)
MATVSDKEGPSDAELIDAVRKGNVAAYGDLYERHAAAAYNLARYLARSQVNADDLVSDAFAKVLEVLKAGRGPDEAFRAYLLTALRHTAYDKTRRDRKLDLVEDVTEANPAATSVPFTDPAVAGLERSLAARAFERLPERWQAVLWHTEIEGQSPAEVAPILGLTPNGVSALAYRAREGLKQAYLQVYLAETTEQRCRATTDRLGAWTRDGLSKREKAQVEAHLDECARCRALAAELADVNSSLRIFVAPLVLGSGTTGYLAAAGAAGGLPRQLLGLAGTTTVLTAALGYAVVLGGEQGIPVAIPVAPPAVQQPLPSGQSSSSGQASVFGTVAAPSLRIREAPSTVVPALRAYSQGTTLSIVCQAVGTEVEGSSLWDRTDRGFVADRYINRPSTPPPC